MKTPNLNFEWEHCLIEDEKIIDLLQVSYVLFLLYRFLILLYKLKCA